MLAATWIVPGSVRAETAGGRAPGNRAVVLSVQAPGRPAALSDDVGGALRDALAARGFDVVPSSAAAGLSPQERRCTEPSCLGRIAASLGTRYVVTATLGGRGQIYDITLRLFDSDSGSFAATEDGTCEICTDEEAVRTAVEVAQRLAPRPREVESAEVETAEVEAPIMPLETPVEETPSGTELRSTRSAGSQRQRLFRTLSYAAIAVGLAGLGSGIPFIVIDGDPVASSPVDQDGDARDLWNSMWLGATLTAVGAGALVAFTTLLVLSFQQDRPQASSAVPLLSPNAEADGVVGLVATWRM